MFFNQLQQPGPPMLPQGPGAMQPGLMQSLPAQVPGAMMGGMQQGPQQPHRAMMPPTMGGGMHQPTGFEIMKILAMLQNKGGTSPMSGGLGSVPPPTLNMPPQQQNGMGGMNPAMMGPLLQMLMR